MDKIYETLQTLALPYHEHTHPAVFTSAEAAKYYDVIPGAHVKNLFLRNRKGDKHYLVVVLDNKTVDLKALALTLGEKQLGFASADRLTKYLQVTPGSVSALGVVFDTAGGVTVLCDDDVQHYDEVCLHPNLNTKTLVLPRSSWLRYMTYTGHAVQFIQI